MFYIHSCVLFTQSKKHEVVKVISEAIQEIMQVFSGREDLTIVTKSSASSSVLPSVLPVINDDTEDAKSSSSPLTTVTSSTGTDSTTDIEDGTLRRQIIKVTNMNT